MLNLSSFPDVSYHDQIPTCEINGKLHYSRIGHSDMHIYTSSVSSHPVISVSKDGSQTAHRAPSSEVFLPSSDSLTQRLQNAWYESGIHQVLEVLADSNDHPICKTLANSILASADLLKKVAHNIGYNNNNEDVDWKLEKKEGPIQLMCWHPHCTKIAVMTREDTITVYSCQSSLTPVLKAKSQSEITSLAWRPLCSGELAVGCKQGIYLWHIDPNSVISRPSINCAIHLTSPGHINITSLAWNPQGTMLASGTREDNRIWVWHVDTKDFICLRRLGGDSTTLVSWSPDGEKLLTATNASIFRLWCCGVEWWAEGWRGNIGTAAFGKDSKRLLFAGRSQPTLFCLEPSRDARLFRTSGDKPVVSVIADLSRVELPSGLCIGGEVKDLAWDPNARYLALTFHDCPVVLLFRTVPIPHFHLISKYYINGTQDEYPNCISFESEFPEGSNLTIAWSSGRVQYFPIIYKLEVPPKIIAGKDHNITGKDRTNLEVTSPRMDRSILDTTVNQSMFYSFTKSPN